MLNTIIPVLCGRIGGVDRGNLTLKHHVGETTWIPLVSGVIRSAETTIVVDTGPGERAASGRTVERADPIATLARAGVDAAGVDLLVLTHLHWDHAGGLERFPAAEILVHRVELQWAVAPAPAHRALYELDGEAPPRWTQSLPRMRSVDRDRELIAGVELVHLPGHSPGLMGLTVETSTGRFVIASDSVPTYENWERRSRLGSTRTSRIATGPSRSRLVGRSDRARTRPRSARRTALRTPSGALTVMWHRWYKVHCRDFKSQMWASILEGNLVMSHHPDSFGRRFHPDRCLP